MTHIKIGKSDSCQKFIKNRNLRGKQNIFVNVVAKCKVKKTLYFKLKFKNNSTVASSFQLKQKQEKLFNN